MSTLQWSIAILAAVVVAVLVGLNVWQASRGRRRLQEASATVAARAEGRLARVEPTIASLPTTDAPRSEPVAAGPGAHAQVASQSPATAQASQAPLPAADGNASPTAAEAGARHVALNLEIDCIVEVELDAPQAGQRLLLATQGLRRVGSKPVQFEGHDVASNEWIALEARRAYGALRCGVLLANRHGPLNAMEFSELAAGLQPIAEQLDSLVHLPDMSAVLAQARDLDARCAELDAQVGLNIESPEPPGVADLQACATANGLVERGNNLYAKLADDGAVLYSLALGDVADRLTLLLDVPRAPAAHEPWRQMVDCAVTCAARLGGRIVDDSGRPLDLAALERIEDQLAERWAALEQAGFPAGSSAALRLFN